MRITTQIPPSINLLHKNILPTNFNILFRFSRVSCFEKREGKYRKNCRLRFKEKNLIAITVYKHSRDIVYTQNMK